MSRTSQLQVDIRSIFLEEDSKEVTKWLAKVAKRKPYQAHQQLLGGLRCPSFESPSKLSFSRGLWFQHKMK